MNTVKAFIFATVITLILFICHVLGTVALTAVFYSFGFGWGIAATVLALVSAAYCCHLTNSSVSEEVLEDYKDDVFSSWALFPLSCIGLRIFDPIKARDAWHAENKTVTGEFQMEIAYCSMSWIWSVWASLFTHRRDALNRAAFGQTILDAFNKASKKKIGIFDEDKEE